MGKISQLELHTLNLPGVYLGCVPAKVLAKAVCKLQHVNLSIKSEHQAKTLFQEIDQSLNLKLDTLKLKFVSMVLEMEASFFANAICKIVNVDLSMCRLSPKCLKNIFESIANSTTLRLQDFALTGTDLSVAPI